jgi:hypothetical protein
MQRHIIDNNWLSVHIKVINARVVVFSSLKVVVLSYWVHTAIYFYNVMLVKGI